MFQEFYPYKLIINQLFWYRKNLIYSPQEPEFVDASLKDNLIGDNKITQENLIKVLKEERHLKLICFRKN